MRKTGLFLLISSCLFSFKAFSVQYYTLAPTVALEYVLPAKEPTVFFNFLFWPIKFNCKINSGTAENLVTINVLLKSGTFNAVLLNAGESVDIIVKDGDIVNLSADSHAKFELINNGEEHIIANCSNS